MRKKILVPIAFSEFTKGLVTYAATIAEPLGADLMLVNVINERDLEAVERIAHFGYKVDAEHYGETIQEERSRDIHALVESLTLPDDQVSFSFLIGDPADELLKLIVKEDIDMVVMGVKTRDVKHLFTGSVAEKLFRKCPCPILSYRGARTREQLRKRLIRHLHIDV